MTIEHAVVQMAPQAGLSRSPFRFIRTKALHGPSTCQEESLIYSKPARGLPLV
jgi:hypothetical protein